MVNNQRIFENNPHLKNISIEALHISQCIANKDDTVSLRDVKRCISLIKWFEKEDPSLKFSRQIDSSSERALILALAICITNILLFCFFS